MAISKKELQQLAKLEEKARIANLPTTASTLTKDQLKELEEHTLCNKDEVHVIIKNTNEIRQKYGKELAEHYFGKEMAKFAKKGVRL